MFEKFVILNYTMPVTAISVAVSSALIFLSVFLGVISSGKRERISNKIIFNSLAHSLGIIIYTVPVMLVPVLLPIVLIKEFRAVRNSVLFMCTGEFKYARKTNIYLTVVICTGLISSILLTVAGWYFLGGILTFIFAILSFGRYHTKEISYAGLTSLKAKGFFEPNKQI